MTDDTRAFTPPQHKPAPGVWVDLPDPNEREPGGAFVDVAEFRTRAEARAWLLSVHGMPEGVADFFITDQ